MMFSHMRTVAALTATVMVSGASVAPLAHATADEIAVNGTYLATSDGQWAKTNESYHDEQTVTQTWTITSSCSSFLDCTGHVTSNQGWSADARYLSGVWRVAHTVAGRYGRDQGAHGLDLLVGDRRHVSPRACGSPWRCPPVWPGPPCGRSRIRAG